MLEGKMIKRRLRIGFATLVCTSLLSAVPSRPRPQPQKVTASEIVLEVDPTQSTVHWTVDSTLHTVHGTFAIKSGSLQFDPGTGRASGEIVVYATSGESGNKSRDARMHKEILETAKYPEIVFRPTQLEGKVAASGPSDCKVQGIFSIHGIDHDIVTPAHAELTGDHWKETSKFEVPYVSWGIKDPGNFLLKVKPVVIVELALSGEVKTRK
jgi:polyisoprenoid-binding protein YceI